MWGRIYWKVSPKPHQLMRRNNVCDMIIVWVLVMNLLGMFYYDVCYELYYEFILCVDCVITWLKPYHDEWGNLKSVTRLVN